MKHCYISHHENVKTLNVENEHKCLDFFSPVLSTFESHHKPSV